jgi:hypothetical protein
VCVYNENILFYGWFGSGAVQQNGLSTHTVNMILDALSEHVSNHVIGNVFPGYFGYG